MNMILSPSAKLSATPNGTTNLGVFAAPPEDAEASTSNTKCWVTQNGAPGGAAGTADVDGGPTDLFTPPIDMAGTDGTISYRRWFYTSGTDGLDTLQVSVSGNGVTWVPVETVGGSTIPL